MGFTGGLTLSGSAHLSVGGAGTTYGSLRFDGTQTLGGTGTVVFASPSGVNDTDAGGHRRDHADDRPGRHRAGQTGASASTPLAAARATSRWSTRARSRPTSPAARSRSAATNWTNAGTGTCAPPQRRRRWPWPVLEQRRAAGRDQRDAVPGRQLHDGRPRQPRRGRRLGQPGRDAEQRRRHAGAERHDRVVECTASTIRGGTVAASGGSKLVRHLRPGRPNRGRCSGVTLSGALDLRPPPAATYRDHRGPDARRRRHPVRSPAPAPAPALPLRFAGAQALGGTGTVTFAGAVYASTTASGGGHRRDDADDRARASPCA